MLGNYTMSGGITFSAVALSRDGTMVTLTTNQAITAGNAYTITMNGLATVSGDQLPASLPLSVTVPDADGRDSGPGLGQPGRQHHGQRPDQSDPQPQLSEQSHVHAPI